MLKDTAAPGTRGGRPTRRPSDAVSVYGPLCALACLTLSCASAGDPPGGPPDQQPPIIARVEPDSGAVLEAPPGEVNIYFDEVVAERVAGQPPAIGSAVLLSPVSGDVRVSWHRDHISVRPKDGFVAGVVYHLQVLPVITDLRTNRMRAGRTIVFSTGPEIPHGVLRGAVVDWTGGRPAARALIEAILLPDSLSYRALSDSGGYFRISELPPGRYLVRGVMDTNNDRRLGGREAWDTVSTTPDTVTTLALYAFVHDTTSPRLRQIEVVDSVTLKLSFSQPLDPSVALDTTMVSFVMQQDSTTRLGIVGVYTQRQLDSLTRAQTDSIAAARAAADSAAAAADTTRRRPAAADTSRGRRPAAAPAVAPTTPVTRTGGRPGATARAPLDSTLAEHMIARRPAPTDIRLVRLAAPIVPDTRYLVFVSGGRNLTGLPVTGRLPLRPPRPPAPRPGARDSLRSDATVRDSTARDASAARDTTPALPTRPHQ